MKVPAYVCLLTDGHVCLSGGIGDVRAPLRSSPLSTRLGRHLGYLAITFNQVQPIPFANTDLHVVMAELNRLGLCFGEDYKQGWSPAEFMRELQRSGALRAAFTAIAWRGPSDWFTTVVPP
jgi:hypothetical protein